MKEKNRLEKERKSLPLDIYPLTVFLHGGSTEYKLHKQALRYVIENTDFLDDDYNYYDRPRFEKRQNSFEDMLKLRELDQNIADKALFQKVIDIIFQSKSGGAGKRFLSFNVSGGAITGQGTKDQIDYYIPKIENAEVVFCFCMTELETGSYIKDFQTTATFIPETDEFEINTPTLSATKWWVGNSAQSATHGIVFARLIIGEKDYGVHNFILQLRDDKFNLCPGVSIGDIGPKRGMNSTDNGWLSFDHVRIPRTQMLMRWNEVSREGTYTSHAVPQITYGALISGRVNIASNAVYFVKKAVTIASRYCIVRNQHTMQGKCLLDYTTQQERIIGALCSAYAFQIGTDKLAEYYLQVDKELKMNDTKNLKELHNNSASFKGFLTLWSNKTINDCILALGGHSYSEISGLPNILNMSAPAIAFEGDAVVLVQQTASHIINSGKEALKGKEISDQSLKYLSKLPSLSEMVSTSDSDKALSFKDMQDSAMWLSLFLTQDSAKDLEIQTKLTGDKEEAWNDCQLKLIQCSKAHFMFTVINMFHEVLVKDLPSALGDASKDVLPILEKVAELFALRHLQEFMTIFYENGYFPLSRGRMIDEQIMTLYQDIRPYVSHLVDAWDIDDKELGTPFGRFDGEIYENYFKAVNDLPQNVSPDYCKKHFNMKPS